ncbi:hypothetical protein [Halomontanus rarus]|uniref:hypothetical protein n=1 Tax=Halomontanus rarus TaxID=3034020 RepID=UPI0023E76C42|nr:hypothetical protein [Halovivax sp. TS33]
MTTRSQLTTIFLVGMLALSMVTFAPAAIAHESDEAHTHGVQTLENGDALYLSFGADLEDMSLEEYVQAHASDDLEQDSVAEIIQYQDVDQVNINTQEGATSVSIDGGEATAIQEASQYNDNDQSAEADATNEAREDRFENVGEVYILLGDGDSQEFDGWTVIDGDGDSDGVSQVAEATVSQSQEVDQLNYNNQSTAIAIAENGSDATALQQSEQHNENLQQGVANATNVYADDTGGDKKKADRNKKEKKKFDGDKKKEKKVVKDKKRGGKVDRGEKKGKKADKDKKKKEKADGDSGTQYAEASVEQAQNVSQTNINEQGAAVAIAVGADSTATAIQVTDQTNLNTQYGSADAANVIGQLGGMNAVSAVTDGESDVLTTDSETNSDTHDKKAKKKKDTDGDSDADSQYAEVEVTQYQSVEQVNINMQNMAIAIATDESEASAVQMSTQENYNVQVGSANATNAETEGAVYTDRTTLTVGGDEVTDNQRLSFDYDGDSEQLNDVDQYTSATVEQVQYVQQLNLNEQHTAIAVAEDGGEASSVQVSMQTNENYQFASALSC